MLEELTWKKVTVVVDSGAAENVMPRSMFTEISTEETERSKKGKGSTGPGAEHFKKSCPSEPRKDSYARARGRLQSDKTSRVSIPQHPSQERLVHREG